MSAGVSGVPSAAALMQWLQPRRQTASPLRLPEEQAFEVSTINQRLAETAARSDKVGSVLDLKA